MRAGEVFQAGLGALFDQGGFEPKTNRSQSGHFQPSLMEMATTTPLLARFRKLAFNLDATWAARSRASLVDTGLE
ncbi:hypothetical protein WH91_20205 [Devosia psychrophila]|uniref:Uncharacterized protein n=1 Tax=Devosia psychrophila TaxID=728005 RepID=A0ABR5DTG6_9HYPH|nr:hypothetical protein WH91_20205 [Devosia psychrophila]